MLTLSSIHPFIDVGLVVVGFVLGTQGANVCPAGSVPMGTVEECESADRAKNGEQPRFFGVLNDANEANYPIGCPVLHANGDVYFNTHETGSSNAAATPICAPSIVQGPISTTRYDLKSSYQNNSCCSQDTGKPATFNGTAVTCGNVLASYKSSECCSADEAKNATMIFN